jgi:hypothetical protein
MVNLSRIKVNMWFRNLYGGDEKQEHPVTKSHWSLLSHFFSVTTSDVRRSVNDSHHADGRAQNGLQQRDLKRFFRSDGEHPAGAHL